MVPTHQQGEQGLFCAGTSRHVRRADHRNELNYSNNYSYQFPEKLIPLFINNIRHRKPLPVYAKVKTCATDCMVNHVQASEIIFILTLNTFMITDKMKWIKSLFIYNNTSVNFYR